MLHAIDVFVQNINLTLGHSRFTHIPNGCP